MHLLDSLRQLFKGVPVVWQDDTLLMLYFPGNEWKIEERKRQMITSIEAIANHISFFPDSLLILTTKQDTFLSYGSTRIFNIYPEDALWEATTVKQLAQKWRQNILLSIQQFHEEQYFRKLIWRIIEIALLLSVIGFAMYGVGWITGYLKRKILKSRFAISKSVQVKNRTLFSRLLFKLIDFFANLVQIGLILLAIFFIVPLFFSLFPGTKQIAEQLLGYIATPLWNILQGFINYLPNLFTIIVIIIVNRVILRLLRFFAEAIEDHHLTISGFHPEWAMPTYQIIRFCMLIFILVAIFPYLPGSNSPFFQGISVFVGILLSFGSSSFVSSGIAGVMLTYMRLFKIGELIQVGNYTGTILEKGLLTIKMRTIKNEIVIIPNTYILNNTVLNYSQSGEYIVRSTVSIGYDVPWRLVHELLLKAAEQTPSVKAHPKPFVLQLSLNDFYITYEINAYTDNSLPYFEVTALLNERIQDEFNRANVQILSPHFMHIKTDKPENP